MKQRGQSLQNVAMILGLVLLVCVISTYTLGQNVKCQINKGASGFGGIGPGACSVAPATPTPDPTPTPHYTGGEIDYPGGFFASHWSDEGPVGIPPAPPSYAGEHYYCPPGYPVLAFPYPLVQCAT